MSEKSETNRRALPAVDCFLFTISTLLCPATTRLCGAEGELLVAAGAVKCSSSSSRSMLTMAYSFYTKPLVLASAAAAAADGGSWVQYGYETQC